MESLTDVDLSKNEKTGKKNNNRFTKYLYGVAILAFIIGGGVYIAVSPRATNVSGIWNKCLSAFHIPNNAYAQKCYDNYNKAKEIGLEEKAETYLNEAFYSNPSQTKLVLDLAKAFEDEADEAGSITDCHQKAISLCKKRIKKDPNDTIALSYLGRCLYNSDSKEESYEVAERLLFLEPNNPLGIDLMCRMAAHSEQWSALEKWGEKGYNNVPKDDSYIAEIMYMYSKGLYENNKKLKAAAIFSEAELIDKKSWARDTYIEAGGMPCEILSLLVSNQKYDGTIIDKPGEKISYFYSNYLTPNLVLKPLRSGSFSFDVKLFKDGELQRSNNSAASYTYSSTAVLNSSLEEQTVVLSGWGSDKNGYWGSGSFRFEIWWRGTKLVVKSFDIR